MSSCEAENISLRINAQAIPTPLKKSVKIDGSDPTMVCDCKRQSRDGANDVPDSDAVLARKLETPAGRVK
jgi:hypothetical protein